MASELKIPSAPQAGFPLHSNKPTGNALAPLNPFGYAKRILTGRAVHFQASVAAKTWTKPILLGIHIRNERLMSKEKAERPTAEVIGMIPSQNFYGQCLFICVLMTNGARKKGDLENEGHGAKGML
jgi:hypothetical protein